MRLRKGKIHWPKRWSSKKKQDYGSENGTNADPDNANNIVPEPDKTTIPHEDEETTDRDSSNLWQVAYESLDQDERSQLDSIRHGVPEEHRDNQHSEDPFISIWLQDTIRTIETQFEVRKAKEDTSRVRRAAKGILDTACSMQSVVGSIAAADPSGHAASAWAVVSLGLTMTQNDRTLQDALFEASEFLTDILARYTLVEKLLHKSHKDARIRLGQSVIRLYVNIMRYALEMTRVREMGVGKRIWISLSVPDLASQQLSTLRARIENEDKSLHSLVDLDQNIQNSQQGEMLLARIEQNSALIQKIDQNFQLSKLPRAAKAINGAWEDRHEELCFKDTREGLLQEIVDWVDDPHGTQFFWLNGMAGTGKSTISRTLAKFFQGRGILGASFFFKKGQEDCDSAKRFVPTIIYQLTKLLPSLKKDIQDVIEKNELIFDQGLEEQFDGLFFNPLSSVRMLQRQILVLILDAVDECQNHHDIMQIFQLLLRTQSVKTLDLRFFITGRPEPAVISSFQNMESNRYREKVLQDIEGVERDISTYMHAKFSEIGAQPGVAASWPEVTMQRLTGKANPLFIVASTICRFVGDEDFDPKERVELILQQPHSDNKLVQTYRTVLDQLILDKSGIDKQQILEDFHRIVGSIVLLYDPLSVTSLARLLEVRQDTIKRRLRLLRSVLVIPNDEHIPIQPLHLSFRDILIDQSTSGMIPFKIDPIKQNQYLADQCLRVMSDHRTGLRRNMCNLANDGYLRSEIHGIGQALSPELRYACRYWAKHLVDGKSVIDQDRIYTFFAEHLLHWLEAMSILGLVPEVSRQLTSIEKLFAVSDTF
ncbi:uncharacterized protein LDX57_006869 [Aspergillus melleus]|uniref:uncharacterized protein n=1 Tax=Aspergillus melleus TaxID=138277 RepID=UPI001E8D0540|nr:uncharacterized protein LDX57_006869 [Aspergillus melleus]KAH8429200.1 hypothetical protein LDX57_006869 [Aspergillus melleus]